MYLCTAANDAGGAASGGGSLALYPPPDYPEPATPSASRPVSWSAGGNGDELDADLGAMYVREYPGNGGWCVP